MKTKLFRAFLFLAIAVGLMFVLSPVFQPREAEELTELEGLGQIDYLIMGDSEGWASAQPMLIWRDYGYTGYNLSRAGQRLQDFYLQLKTTLETQHPQVLLLETDILYKSVGMIGESEGFLTTVLSQAIPFLRYHERWEDWLPELGNDSIFTARFGAPTSTPLWHLTPEATIPNPQTRSGTCPGRSGILPTKLCSCVRRMIFS